MSKHRTSFFIEVPDTRTFGIVTENVVARCMNPYNMPPTTIFRGEAVIVHSMDKRSSTACITWIQDSNSTCNSYEEDVYQCSVKYLKILDQSVWNLVVAIASRADRINITEDHRLLNDLLTIEESSVVKVLTRNNKGGIVVNKSRVPELGPGIYFEVELFEDSDNSRLEYFAVNELRPLESVHLSKKSRGNYTATAAAKIKHEFAIFDKDSPTRTNKEELFICDPKLSGNKRFNRGDRIVWKNGVNETKTGMICLRSHLGGSKLLVHLDSNCKEVGCDRSGTNPIPIDEVLTEDEYLERRNAAITQSRNDVRVEDLLGIDQLDNRSVYKPSYSSVVKDYDKEYAKRSTSNALSKHESRQSSDEDLSNANDLGIGSMVKISIGGQSYYGVIKFIGPINYGSRASTGPLVAGIELEEESEKFGDGYINGTKYFDCAPYRGTFSLLRQCEVDSRFQDSLRPSASEIRTPEDFGKAVIPGVVEPITQLENMHLLCGKYKGIQGHNNSCYLDATLFSMFIFTSVFDDLLYRPANDSDIQEYEEVQRVLREEIVNPLRKNFYVRSDRVMKLRTLLDNLTSVTGLTCEEKDPEEFLTSLVAQVLKAEPYLKLSSDHEAYYYQLFVEKDERLKLPTVQQLLQQSFITSDIKLKEVPSCLIIQMPRFGKSYKMYPRILPSQILDVTDIIENTPRVCSLCAQLAYYECKECFKDCSEESEFYSFCSKCVKTFHGHDKRTHHKYTRLTIPREFDKSTNYKSMPRHFMELFAVLCIETSHYVAFVKCGLGPDTPWCFFDSMADREGGSSGHNIPEMVLCSDLPLWLSDQGAKVFCEMKDDRHLDPYAKRLLCDAYMCLYQSKDVMMYR